MWQINSRFVLPEALSGLLGCLALAWLGLGIPASVAGADPPPGQADPNVIPGCGKACAAARGLFTTEEGPVDRRYREAMADTDVQHYKLDIEVSDLQPYPVNVCTINGTNRMTIRSNVDGLTEFSFRLRSQYDVTAALIDDTTPVTVTTASTTTRVATLDRAYNTGEEFTLTIEYSGDSVSYGFAPYGSIGVGSQFGTFVVFTMSCPYYSYTWWPVKDGDIEVPGDNSDKATLEIAITVPNNFVVPSNGTLKGVDTLSDNRKRYRWATNYPIAPYLVCFSATNYHTWSVNYNHATGVMPVEFYIYPGYDNPANRASWEKVVDMIEVFAQFYGEYPFIDDKYGIYNFPFGGGMEHQTMTGQSSFDESLTAHELSHQWWGNMITCRTWSDIWLNEGFAKYSECLWEEFKSGTADPIAYHDAIVARKPTVSSIDGTVYIYYPGDMTLGRIYDRDLTYLKGAWVVHQLRHVMGDNGFFDMLADYRAAYAFSAATTDDFAAVASAAYGDDLSWFFDQWVYQPGWPSYEYGWDTVSVAGQDYLHVQINQVQSAGYPDVFIMPVNLELTIGAGSEMVTVWNDERIQTIVVPISGPATDLQFDPDDRILRLSTTSITYVVGDLDDDYDVDEDDALLFEGCFTGAGGQFSSGCAPVDFEGDGDVDCVDWAQFVLAWTAPGDPPESSLCGLMGAPQAAPFPHDAPKNRYISFDPNKAENDGVNVAFKVILQSIRLGSCSGNGSRCRLDRGGADCGVCSFSGDPCIEALIDCVPSGQTCNPTAQTCVNDRAGSAGTMWWVGPESGLGNGVHLLVSEAFRKVSTGWPAVVHVGDCEIVPRAEYGLWAVNADTGAESDELLVSSMGKPGTNYWADGVGSLTFFCDGDIRNEICDPDNNTCPMGQPCLPAWRLPDGVTNFDDISATVFMFQQIPGLTLPEITWVDMHGNDGGDGNVDPPNYVANFSDIAFITLAFQGRPYPFSDPALCPDVVVWP